MTNDHHHHNHEHMDHGDMNHAVETTTINVLSNTLMPLLNNLTSLVPLDNVGHDPHAGHDSHAGHAGHDSMGGGDAAGIVSRFVKF